MAENGRPPTKLAKQLAAKDFTTQVASLGEARTISRQMLQQTLGQFDPEVIDLRRLHQMRRDPMVQMGLHYTKAPLLRAKWHIESDDPQIAAGVDEILRKVYGPLMRIGLNMLDFGYSGAIKRFEYGELLGEFETEEGAIRRIWNEPGVSPLMLRTPVPLYPDYTQVKLDKGKFDGIHLALVTPTPDANKRHIDPDYCLWWTNEFEESFGNWYGYPRTGYAYRYWWSYWFRWHMADRHFEQDADPPLQVWYPPGSSQRPGSAESVSNAAIALEIGNDLRGGATIAIPSDVHVDEMGRSTAQPLWKAEFLRGGENLQAFNQSFEYLDVLKLRSILVPEQALVEGKGGTSSRNVASTYGEIFTESLAQMADDLDDVINKHVIPQLVDANWGPDAARATKKTTGFQQEDLSLATELIKIAFNLDPNAMPIKFEELVRMAGLPMYTPKEQEEREEAAEQAAQAKVQAQAQAAVDAGGIPAGPDPGAGGVVNASGRYFRPRDVVHLHQGGTKVPSTQPAWARQEFERRANNSRHLAARIEGTVRERYEVLFDTVAEAVAQEDELQMSRVTDAVGGLVRKIMDYVRGRMQRYDQRVQGDLASLYHTAGAAELARLGLDQESWDVGRDEVQEWARERAGSLITTMDATVVEQHLRPFLQSELSKADSPPGFSGEPIELAQRISDKFVEYPNWMARRVARTEARMGYNQASLSIWDHVGVTEVQAYDGQGGASGVTDLECLRRNGEVYTLEEALEEDLKEHPNGTLSFIPITEGVELRPLDGSRTVMASQVVSSREIVAVTEDGWILSAEETGKLLAES